MSTEEILDQLDQSEMDEAMNKNNSKNTLE